MTDEKLPSQIPVTISVPEDMHMIWFRECLDLAVKQNKFENKVMLDSHVPDLIWELKTRGKQRPHEKKTKKTSREMAYLYGKLWIWYHGINSLEHNW